MTVPLFVYQFYVCLFCFQVKVEFLMVGHTHEDIDQFFSCIARLLNKFKVLTLSQLLEKVKQVNRKDPVDAEILEYIFDVREWIDDFIPNLHGHLKSYQFKFVAEGEGVQFFYRKRSTSTQWILVDQEQYPIFQELSTGKPQLVDSLFVEMKVPIFTGHLRATCFKWMPDDYNKEWEEWILKTQEAIDGKNTTGTWNILVCHEDQSNKDLREK